MAATVATTPTEQNSMTTTPATWSKPYYGVQHLVQAGKEGQTTSASWCTVVDHGTWAESTFWPAGAGFGRAINLQHDSAADARVACEKWLSGQYV
jgi:hypothetical protein